MGRRMTQLSNLIELIDNNTITVANVQCKAKVSADEVETDQVTPGKFMEAVRHLNEASLFRNGIDFYYKFMGKNNIRIKCGMKNPCMDQYFYVDCMIRDGISVEDVCAKLEGINFGRMDGKIAV